MMVIVNRWIGVKDGYLGDFTYRSHEEFYPEYCNLDYRPDELEGTTRERFIEILKGAPPEHQAKILSGVLERFPLDAEDAPSTRTQALEDRLQAEAKRLSSSEGVLSPSPADSSDVVRRALEDAQLLIEERGAVSTVDRVHTALHGHLAALCQDAGIAHGRGDSLTRLFKTLRRDHPSLQDPGPRADDLQRILRAMASIMDSLQPIRNKASLAHPNALLAEAEAMLVVNSARTIFHYLDMKLGLEDR